MKILFVTILSTLILLFIQSSTVYADQNLENVGQHSELYAERELSNKEKNALKKKPTVLGEEGLGIYEGEDTLFDEIKSLMGGETEKDKREKAAQEKAAQEKAAEEKAAQEKLLLEKAAEEKAAQEKLLLEKAAQEKLLLEKAAEEKAAQEKATKEDLIKDRLLLEKAAQEKAAQEKLLVEKAAQERATERMWQELFAKSYEIFKNSIPVVLIFALLFFLHKRESKLESDIMYNILRAAKPGLSIIRLFTSKNSRQEKYENFSSKYLEKLRNTLVEMFVIASSTTQKAHDNEMQKIKAIKGQIEEEQNAIKILNSRIEEERLIFKDLKTRHKYLEGMVDNR